MISLLIMDSSNIAYLNKTDDPWFSATTVFEGGVASVDPPPVMGCLSYKSFCNPDLEDTKNCVNSYVEVGKEALSKVWPKPEDQSVIAPLLSVLDNYVSSISDILYLTPGLPSLLARNSMISGTQWAPLPANQWQLEREHIFKANLAAMQAYMVDFARGFWMPIGTFCKQGEVCRRICHSQVSLNVCSQDPCG